MKMATIDLKPGLSLPEVSRRLSAEEIVSYCRRERTLWGLPVDVKNIHTDEETARSFGLRGVVAPGIQTMAFIWGMLRDTFGDPWLKDGKLAVTFTDMVCGGDVVTAKAVVQEPAEGEAGDRLYLDTWMENQEGEKVIVGRASLPLD